MSDLSPLNLAPSEWQFLDKHNEYCELWNQLNRSGFKMFPVAMSRQMRSASEILSRYRSQGGVLLADDVGMGKTAVAIFVAAVFANKKMKVRILAPNKVMRRKWETDLRRHLEILGKLDKGLGLGESNVRGDKTRRLRSGQITVSTHASLSGRTLACDLLIVDEAHRARGDKTKLRRALAHARARQHFKRVLFLTATPFSIDTGQLASMLAFIGAQPDNRSKVRSFSRRLAGFWTAGSPHQGKNVAQLLEARKDALEAIKPWVIRHSVQNQHAELVRYGKRETWNIPVPPATEETLELLLRSDRVLALGKRVACHDGVGTNDPRNHVGWRHLHDEVRDLRLQSRASGGVGADWEAFTEHLDQLGRALGSAGEHPKVKKVVAAIMEEVRQGEKVLVFCHHHSTAVEVTEYISKNSDDTEIKSFITLETWRAAWDRVLDDNELKVPFIAWLSSCFIKRQIECRLAELPTTVEGFVSVFQSTAARKNSTETIASAAQGLLDRLTLAESRSTRKILEMVARNPDTLERELPCAPVVSVADPGQGESRAGPRLFFSHSQPDTLMEIFNSPFGPDVLVATDRLSEGVDLHRYCRHLVHYELSPSPIRVVQRNGRIRRLNSWAAQIGKPIRIAYPSFSGTRDQKLVAIMEQRLSCFEMLLGGVGAKITDEDLDDGNQDFQEAVQRLHEADKDIDPLAVY